MAKLQTKLEEVQRENIKNYQMYEGMKDINRKMKAVSEEEQMEATRVPRRYSHDEGERGDM